MSERPAATQFARGFAPAFRALVLGLSLSMAGGGTVFADDTPLYIGVRAIGAYSMMNDTQTSGFTGTTQIEHDTDSVAGLGVVFGYVVPRIPVRVELEVVRRFRFDYDVRELRPTTTIDDEANVSTTSALVSGILEWRNESAWTPYVGGSIGWARNSTHVTRTNIGTQTESSRDTDSDNFAWGALVGVDWAFARNWTAGFAYRYTNLGEVDAGRAPTGDQFTADSYTSHDLLLSLIYRF